MAINVERLLQRDLDRWAHLLGLGKWRITWELIFGPIDSEEPIARNDHFVYRSGYRKAHIRFDARQITTAPQVERAVIHELIHLLHWGKGNDAEKLIERLERPLIRVRKRLSRH